MDFKDFPHEMSLPFRLHVLCVYAQSTLDLMNELAADGPTTFSNDDLKAIDDATAELERIWFEAAKIKKQARA